MEATSTVSDIVIPVMGPTGAGKSTFINAILGEERMVVGHGLTSCTHDIVVSKIDLSSVHTLPGLQQYRLIIVDTPGFDDTYEGDADILRKIADWLEASYLHQMILGGVIYLHDISSDRFSGTARRNLETFNHMCGDAALSKVVLGTTKWSRAPNASSREQELKEAHWKAMIQKGTQTCQFHDDHTSAWAFVEVILRNFAINNILDIQKELAIDKKILPETRAGKELRYSLQQALELQKKFLDIEIKISQDEDQDKIQEQLEAARHNVQAIVKQIQDLKIPASRRIRALLGLV